MVKKLLHNDLEFEASWDAASAQIAVVATAAMLGSRALRVPQQHWLLDEDPGIYESFHHDSARY